MEKAQLKEALFGVLRSKGAVLCGVGDMTPFVRSGLTIGVSVAVPVPAKIVRDLRNAPTLEYLEAYQTLNAQLNDIVTAGAEFLREQGYQAYANTTDVVTVDENRRSPIPHKTFATRAGLGWIGKNCLLITPEYGGSVRLSSLLTDAPLPCDEAITQCRCGSCTACMNACPAHALTGRVWTAGMEREELLDRESCYAMQLKRMEAATGVVTDLCGLCFAVCPYTLKRLAREEKVSL